MHACILFLSAALLVFILIASLYAVNSPMSPQLRSIFGIVNLAAFFVSSVTFLNLSYNVSKTSIESDFAMACYDQDSPISQLDAFVN